jgi:voltage-gated potassium channel
MLVFFPVDPAPTRWADRFGAARVESITVLSFLALLRHFARAFSGLMRDPETRSIPGVALALLLSGTLFYWQVEGWSLLDALYFSVTTLTTVGLGDLTPTTSASKLFTALYILVGIGVLVAFATAMGEQLLRTERERHASRDRGTPRRPAAAARTRGRAAYGMPSLQYWASG